MAIRVEHLSRRYRIGGPQAVVRERVPGEGHHDEKTGSDHH